MIYSVAFDDEIRIWWDARKNVKDGYQYKLTLNGKNCIFTKEIYYDFKNLESGKEYDFTLELVDKNKQTVGEAEKKSISTLPYKSRIDVTKAPYFALGDGKTDNTRVLQDVFDNCTAKEYVYFPMGVYLCGALKMRGDIKIRFDAGAELSSKNM